MTFGQGIYIIKSFSLDSYVGRDLREDMSLLPKRVFVLPKGVQAPKWEIISSEDGAYIFKTLGAHAADINEHLFGILLPEPPATKWKVVAHPRYGKHVYSILEVGGPRGWASPEDTYQQIFVTPHIIGPSDPPHVPAHQLFEITRFE